MPRFFWVPRQRSSKPFLEKYSLSSTGTEPWFQPDPSPALRGFRVSSGIPPSPTDTSLPVPFLRAAKLSEIRKKPNLIYIRLVCHSWSGSVLPTNTLTLTFPSPSCPGHSTHGRQTRLWTVVWAFSASSSSTGTLTLRQSHDREQVSRGEYWGRCWENRVEAHSERQRQQSPPLHQLYRKDMELVPEGTQTACLDSWVNFSVNVHRMGMPGPVWDGGVEWDKQGYLALPTALCPGRVRKMLSVCSVKQATVRKRSLHPCLTETIH